VTQIYAWLNTLVGLIVIVNPLLGVSMIASLTEGETRLQRRATARAAALTVAVVLSLSAVAGEAVLSFFGIGIPQFQVGGGILILLMAVSMLHARMGDVRQTDEETSEAQDRANVGVVPLGLPLLAGPGAISTAILYAHKQPGWLGTAIVVGEIWVVAALVWVALLSGDLLVKILGKTGLNIATRIMGLILAAIAVGFVTQGVKTLLPGLG
jgi:multiple antibiotic resistance protein